MYPNSIDFGLKVVPISVLWGLSIYYLGTWTFKPSTVYDSSGTLIVALKGTPEGRAFPVWEVVSALRQLDLPLDAQEDQAQKHHQGLGEWIPFVVPL